jgi:hypothetical protein
LKTQYSKCLDWGELFSVANENVVQFAWKDAQVVLFSSTVHDGHSTVVRPRKRPHNATQKEIATTWGSCHVKDKPIPTAIDDYNHHMGAVDQADQSRKVYNRRTRQRRTWKPLFKFLLQSSVCNAAKLWIKTRSSSQRSEPLNFRLDVALGLLSGTKAALKGLRGERTQLQSKQQTRLQVPCNGPSLMGWRDGKACTSCQSNGRRIGKRQFREISGSELNSRQGQGQSQSQQSRLKRTKHGCTSCQVAVCNTSICWQDHTG